MTIQANSCECWLPNTSKAQSLEDLSRSEWPWCNPHVRLRPRHIFYWEFIFSSALMMIVCAWYHSPAGLILNSLTCVLSAITQHPYQNVQVWRRAVRNWNWLTPRINHPGAILKFMMSVESFGRRFLHTLSPLQVTMATVKNSGWSETNAFLAKKENNGTALLIYRAYLMPICVCTPLFTRVWHIISASTWVFVDVSDMSMLASFQSED